ncbi:MAG: glutamine-hydrolyzing carbamoyl-phosphate synthase small subunit [Calditrichia bacterium]
MSQSTNAKFPPAKLTLKDGTVFRGFSFGYAAPAAGEVVFNTGMVGYPETLTDPSYYGQILVLTYPLIGNYGVPPAAEADPLSSFFESPRVQIRGLILSTQIEEFSHWSAATSLREWLLREKIPALCGIDTRQLTRLLREHGTMLGKIEIGDSRTDYDDPNQRNLMPSVSIPAPQKLGSGKIRIALLDCGCKAGIIRSLLKRGLEILRLPWNHDLTREDFDGLLVSNGPGNPKMCRPTILQIQQAVRRNVPILGICLGNQLLALAAGANTYKLKYGHRGQNQPVIETGTNRCLITSQNHGFAVDGTTLPDDWQPWFLNLNDGSVEGIRHRSGRFLGVQFHPEASPGPEDAEYLFDQFLELIQK